MCALKSHNSCLHRLSVSFCFFACLLYSQLSFSDQNNGLDNYRDSDPDDHLLDFSLCPAVDPQSSQHVTPRSFELDSLDNTDIYADHTVTSEDGSITLNGDVVIERHQLRISADKAHYNKPLDTLEFSGNVHIDTNTMSLDADDGTFNTADTGSEETSNTGEFKNTRFYIPLNNMKGQAGSIDTQNADYSTLTDASITSCQLLDPDWLLSADEIQLDHLDEYGTADDVVMRFKGVSIMYTPYIEFPTSDRRRSGLLFPSVGTSSSRGVEIALPWYWNIAANHDATITPRNMVKRGVGVNGEYRYLTESTSGEFAGDYVPEDKKTLEDRYHVRYVQKTDIISNLRLNIDLQDISDTEYFNDYANSLGTTSQTHLNRFAKLNYALTDWQVAAMAQDIKTIDTSKPISNRVYKRQPQVTLNGSEELGQSMLLFSLDSELVDFAHDDDTKTTGKRITLQPAISLPLSGAAWFFEPKLKYSYTQYDLDAINGAKPASDDVSLPVTSIDAGLFFERFLDNGYIQTLEPRLYYLKVPFQDQSNNPDFDTSTPTFSVAQLFRDNRFVGGDRFGDANQLTLAISSQILNTATGDELLRASIGQIFYFQDRQVSLDNTVETAKQSDLIAELDTHWGDWQSKIDMQWDTVNSEMAKENYFLNYLSDPRHIFNIGYRKQLKNSSIDIEQTDTSFVYGINNRYSALARWNYSLVDRKAIDSIIGLAYDSCCWSIQLTAQRRLKNLSNANTVSDEYDNSILVQFAFKGLGSVENSNTRSTLQQSIYSYTDIYQ